MTTLISWSGPTGQSIAGALRDWCENVVPSCDPWLSTRDIPLGKKWRQELNEALVRASAAIVVLTPESLVSRYVHYEVGRIDQRLEQSAIFTALWKLGPSDIPDPLAEFQHVALDEAGLKRLAADLDKLQKQPQSPQMLAKRLTQAWPDISNELDRTAQATEDEEAAPPRTDSEKLDEILAIARELIGAQEDDVEPRPGSFWWKPGYTRHLGNGFFLARPWEPYADPTRGVGPSAAAPQSDETASPPPER